MTQVIHLLVFLQVSSESTSTHMLQTLLLHSTTLQVIKVHHLMTQVYSTAHTFLYRWYVVWEQTVSNQRLDSRLVTESLQTHLLKEQHSPHLVFFHVTATYTTEELKLQTLCNSYFTYFFKEMSLTSLFFVLVCIGTTQIQT